MDASAATCIESRYAEYTRYEAGKPVQMSIVGQSPPQDAPKGLPALDLDWDDPADAASSARIRKIRRAQR